MNLQALQESLINHLILGESDIDPHVRGDSAPRLAVYHNAYRMQLLDCLRGTYEKTHEWLGPDPFDKMGRAYIEAHPPVSWTLNEYGIAFDRTLRGLFPDDPEVAELASLEWALRRAFDGPDAPALAAEHLANVDWDTAVLRLAPTLRVLPITSNCAAIWSALAQGVMPPAAARLESPMALRVWRRELNPEFRSINEVEREVLALVTGGARFARVGQVLGEGEHVGDAIERAAAVLASWLKDGLVVGVEQSSACEAGAITMMMASGLNEAD